MTPSTSTTPSRVSRELTPHYGTHPALLAKAGHKVLPYTGRTDQAERLLAEEALKNNEVKALIATSALGMGFDKPDLGFVVHLGAPNSPVAYYQQVGRAGRATDSADVLLLPGMEDREIWHYFATTAMPTKARGDAVLTALAEQSPLSVAALESRVDLKRGQLELLLKVLAVDGAVSFGAGGWSATVCPGPMTRSATTGSPPLGSGSRIRCWSTKPFPRGRVVWRS